MEDDRKSGNLKGIEPDSKSQVTMLYENEKPVKVTSVVISTQHSKNLNQEKVREAIIPYIKKTIPEIQLVIVGTSTTDTVFLMLDEKQNIDQPVFIYDSFEDVYYETYYCFCCRLFLGG